jgi:hypothetical protein
MWWVRYSPSIHVTWSIGTRRTDAGIAGADGRPGRRPNPCLIFARRFSLLAVHWQHGHKGRLMHGEGANKRWIFQRHSQGERAAAGPANKMNRSRIE